MQIQKGIAEAESLLEDLGYDTLPVRPFDVARSIHSDDFKLSMELQSFDSDKILGRAEGNIKGALVYINSNIPDPGRLNFTAAHELGHVCMHIMPMVKSSFECGTKELSNQFNDPIEQEANGFASGLLIPQPLTSKLTDGDINWSNIDIVSRACEASLEATYRKMAYSNKSPSALIIHQNGHFVRFVPMNNFAYFIEQSTLTREQQASLTDVRSENYPTYFDEVDAIDWVNPSSKHGRLSTIYCSSILLNDGFSYTLLAYDDDCLVGVEEEY
ncbi:MAG: hypothetical protein C0631_15765 [Sedimenticola sp.]|nr:MAG: hypothetical protein C0631_15765 [Sedimenticola sp.]